MIQRNPLRNRVLLRQGSFTRCTAVPCGNRGLVLRESGRQILSIDEQHIDLCVQQWENSRSIILQPMQRHSIADSANFIYVIYIIIYNNRSKSLQCCLEVGGGGGGGGADHAKATPHPSPLNQNNGLRLSWGGTGKMHDFTMSVPSFAD